MILQTKNRQSEEALMKLYVTAGAPNPRRVTMFMAEKRIEGVVNHTGFRGGLNS